MSYEFIHQLVRGIVLSGSLIIAIGGQNAFLLKHALQKNHIFVICTICLISDILFLFVGVFGFGALLSTNKYLGLGMTIVGALFLFFYGLLSFRNSFVSNDAMDVSVSNKKPKSLKKLVLATLAITYLNPHVYLDTIVIIGGIAAPLKADGQLGFFIGSSIVSFVWFYGVGYGARLLIPLFRSPRAWRILEFVTGVIMWYIAFSLLIYAKNHFF